MTGIQRLPERLPGPSGLLLRRWTAGDAERLSDAITQSLEHLRPWMTFIADEPMALEDRRSMIEDWQRDWERGGDVILGIFCHGEVAGSCGLHHRLGPDGLEIGYWIHADFVRRGLASTASALLTDAAFGRPEIEVVQIRHDKANLRSAAVPRKLGFAMVQEVDDEVTAPGEVGTSWYWRMDRANWSARAPLVAAVSPRC